MKAIRGTVITLALFGCGSAPIDTGRAGIYIGSARCAWTEMTRGGTSQTGSYNFDIHFEVESDGSISFNNGDTLRVGLVQTATFGDTTQTVRITGFSESANGYTWTADWTTSNADGDFDGDVNGTIRFNGDSATFQRTIVGVYVGGGITIDRVEQCTGSNIR